MDCVWRLPCDLIVEEYHPRTNARTQQWQLKQERIILEYESGASSATLYIPRRVGTTSSLPIRLLHSTFTLHTRFLATEGKCSVRFHSPVNLCVMISGIAKEYMQAAINLLNAIVQSKDGVPDDRTSTSMTGEGERSEDRHVEQRRRTTTTTERKSTASSTSTRRPRLDDDVDDDLDSDEENRPPHQQNRRLISAPSTPSSRNNHSSSSTISSPQRYLSPQSLKFLTLPQHEQTRILTQFPSYKAKRMLRFEKDAPWKRREGMYEKVLLDRSGVSHEQLTVLKHIALGHSIFFTGSAGTGKSFVVKKIVEMLPGAATTQLSTNITSSSSSSSTSQQQQQTTYITSTTGITAMSISGQTLYAWAGLGVLSGKEKLEDLASRVRRNRELWMRWIHTRTLLIDEISMLDGAYFQTLHELAQLIRGNTKPFGGIQLILTGDFYQLPPVVSSSIAKGELPKQFAFETAAWQECIQHSVTLTHVFRQKDDHLFIEILNELREGKCTKESASMLRECESREHIEKMYSLSARDGIKPTSLVTLKSEVDTINTRELNALSGKVHTFGAKDNGGTTALLDSSTPARSRLDLKEGAQVMLLKNLDVAAGLCNGSRGILVRFSSTPTGYPIVRFTGSLQEHTITPQTWEIVFNGQVTASRTALPLTLSWAISIHKSQGLTLDRCMIHLSNVFEYGQVYVALSRCRNLNGICLKGFDVGRVRAHPKVVQFYDTMKKERAEVEKQLEERRKRKVYSPGTLKKMDENRPPPPMSDEKVLAPTTTAAASSSSSTSTTSLTTAAANKSRIRKRTEEEDENEPGAAPTTTMTIPSLPQTQATTSSIPARNTVQKRLEFPARKIRRIGENDLVDAKTQPSSDKENIALHTTLPKLLPPIKPPVPTSRPPLSTIPLMARSSLYSIF